MQGLRGKLMHLEWGRGVPPAGVAWPRLLGTAQNSRGTGPGSPPPPLPGQMPTRTGSQSWPSFVRAQKEHQVSGGTRVTSKIIIQGRGAWRVWTREGISNGGRAWGPPRARPKHAHPGRHRQAGSEQPAGSLPGAPSTLPGHHGWLAAAPCPRTGGYWA